MKLSQIASALNTSFYPEATGKLTSANTDANTLSGVALAVDDLGYIKQGKQASGDNSPALIEKTITENGVYNASSDNADGYSKVTVNVNDYKSALTDLIEGDIVSIDIPDTVTRIGNTAFYNCGNLSTITIPNSVTSIGSKAFYNCVSLMTITIPRSVTYIDTEAFSNTYLTTITINKPTDSISGAPWGASDATIEWTG